MENFFIDDKFYTNIEELLEDLEIETIDEIPETYSERAESASLEPISEGITHDYLVDTIFSYLEDRMPEDYTEKFEAKIINAIKEAIDIEKINSLMPKLWYGNNQFFTITREDLISYLDVPEQTIF